MLDITLKAGYKPPFFKKNLDDSTTVKKMVALAGEVQSIQADGHELAKCCEILGRTLPKARVYTFFGDNANEIVANWCEFD